MGLAFGWLVIDDGVVLVGYYWYHTGYMYGDGVGLACVSVMCCDGLCG